MTPEKAISQLRLEVLNARECDDDTVDVPVDVIEAALAEIDRLRKSQAPTHIHFKFDGTELTAPIGSGADHITFDEDPEAVTDRFNARGVVINKANLKAVQLLTPGEVNELGIGADSLFNRRTIRKET